MVGPPFAKLRVLSLAEGTTKMNSPDLHTEHGKPPTITSFRVLVARLMWVMLGPLTLLLIAMGIVSGGHGWTTGLDIFFAIVVLLMIAGRWIEQQSGEGTTFQGDAESTGHCKRYTVGLLAAAGAVWVTANVLGNHLLG